jgi:7-cyano-7-deazaguanine reductase
LKVNADSIGTSQQKATYFTNLLKSNCKVTGQPDWGSATIFLSGAQIPDKQDMLAYLLSFKDEFHFHEEVAERIVFDLVTIYDADEVVVILNYTRRGGIDINPIRIYSKHDLAQWSEWLAAFEWKRHIRQ